MAAEKLAASSTDGSIAAFDLDGEGSLAVWFSSFLLLLASAAAALVYSVRRFRADDYKGDYRIWIWAALCWLVMSIDETSSLHEGFKEGMALFTGTRIMGDGSMWWIMAYFFILAPIGARLLIDMRESKMSVASFFCVALCYVGAVLAQLGAFLPTESHVAIMIEEGLEMLGNLFLLTTMCLYLRHVVADAEGLLPQVSKAEKDAIREPEDEEEYEYYSEDDEEEEYDIDEEREAALQERARTIRIGSARAAKRKPARPEPKPQTQSASVQFSSLAEAEDFFGRKLTKQEKKRIRRQIVNQRNRAG